MGFGVSTTVTSSLSSVAVMRERFGLLSAVAFTTFDSDTVVAAEFCCSSINPIKVSFFTPLNLIVLAALAIC